VAPAVEREPVAIRKPSLSARKLLRGDAMVKAGDTAGAVGYFEGLARARPDRWNTTLKARTRLAALYLTLNRYDDARAQVRLVEKAANDPALKARARQVAADIDFAFGADMADADLRAIDTEMEAIDQARNAAGPEDAAVDRSHLYDGVETKLVALLARPCPLSPDFGSRVRTRLATARLRVNDVPGARRWLATIDQSAARPATLARTRDLGLRADQLDRDLSLRADLAKVREQAQTDLPGALVAIDRVTTANPGASADQLALVQIYKADLLSRADAFAPARALAMQVVAASPDEGVKAAGAAALVRIGSRELQAQAAAETVAADGMAERADLTAAYAAYDRVVSNGQYSPDSRQRASLRKSVLLRREGDYEASAAALTEVGGSPANEGIATRVKDLRAALDAVTPATLLKGAYEIGLGWDSNAPAITSVNRSEDESLAPYPSSSDFPDEFVTGLVSAEYHRRINARNDYWLVDSALSATKQASLDRLDRVTLAMNGGRVFQLPQTRSVMQITGGYAYNRRGGQTLYQDLVLDAAIDHRLGARRVAHVAYALTARHDDAGLYSGVYQQLSLDLTPNGGLGLALSADLGRNDADAKVRANTFVEGGLRYRHSLGMIGQAKAVAALSGSYRVQKYDEAVVFPDPVSRNHTSNRVRLGAGVDFTLRSETVLSVGYGYLNLDSSVAGGDRRNHRIEVSVAKRF
jgi:hypothetical protein